MSNHALASSRLYMVTQCDDAWHIMGTVPLAVRPGRGVDHARHATASKIFSDPVLRDKHLWKS